MAKTPRGRAAISLPINVRPNKWLQVTGFLRKGYPIEALVRTHNEPSAVELDTLINQVPVREIKAPSAVNVYADPKIAVNAPLRICTR